MDITSKQYDEGMSLYLTMLGVNKIDEEYNAAIKQFEAQLEEQEIAAKLQANVAASSAANMAVEAQPGLGTGAAGVASQARQSQLSGMHETIEQNVAETYQSGVQQMSESYQAQLESILGTYDPATGTFADLANYELMSNKVNEAMAKVLAMTIDPLVDTTSDSYLDVLKAAGFLADSEIPGEFVLSESGEEQIDILVNGVSANTPQTVLGGNSLGAALALQMAMSDYAGVLDDGTPIWESLSDTKRAEITKEYESWIYNNNDNLRLTAWDLYDITDEGVEIDRFYAASSLETNVTGVSGTSGIHVTQLTVMSENNPNGIPDCTEEELAEVKTEILTGKIPDGSYFTFQRGKSYEDDRFYYVKDGVIYDTEYTGSNPPEIISVESATVRSFGVYQDTGEGTHRGQDKYVQRIIDCARIGKIPDGTYIDFNYGFAASASTWYKYEDDEFKRVSNDEVVIHGDPSSLDFYTRNDVIQIGPTSMSGGAEAILGAADWRLGTNRLNW